MEFYPCFMISKTLLDGGKWKDDEIITLQTEDGDASQLGSAIEQKLEMGNREWDDFKYLLRVLHGDRAAALFGSKVKMFVRAVIRSYEGTVVDAKRAPLTFLLSQGDSYGRLTVYWTPNFRDGIPSYVSTQTPDYLWIETEDAKVAWKNA